MAAAAASRPKPYLYVVIICANSCDKLTKSENVSRPKPYIYVVIICANSCEKLTKSENVYQAEVGSSIAQNRCLPIGT